MGFDVYGQNPSSEVGKYFRNSVWYFHPLWRYIQEVAPDLVASVSGHSNDGDGLNAEDATRLAQVLTEELDSGRTAAYARAYQEEIDALPDEPCPLCEGSGIRHDGAHVNEMIGSSSLPNDFPCNGCDGKGHRRPWEANYPFEVENVREFRDFIQHSGGFEIC